MRRRFESCRAHARPQGKLGSGGGACPIRLHLDGTRMTVVQVHPDSASMELHMEVAGPEFAKFKDLITMRTMDVYGRPSDKLLRLMQQKAEMLGSAAVGVHELAAGFTRLATR